ncbi:MAG: hypothetical protein AABZ39_08520 [Spirochaetota bacterium]
MKKPVQLTVLLGICFMLTDMPAYGCSFSAYNGMTGERTLAIVPTVYVPMIPAFGALSDYIAAYGFTQNIDLFVNFATLAYAPVFGYTGSWIMPRFDFGGNNIAALQVFLDYSAAGGVRFRFAPQYHFFIENDAYAFELNGIVIVPLSTPANTSISAIIAPVWKMIKNAVHLFVEVNPCFTFGVNTFSLAVIPGACLCFSENAHQICVGVPCNNVTSGTLSLGVNVWYTGTFKL